LYLCVAVRERLVSHEAGEDGLAHAALALVSSTDLGMFVELAEEPRVVQADDCEHHRACGIAGTAWSGAGRKRVAAQREARDAPESAARALLRPQSFRRSLFLRFVEWFV
jgi:hypothetical protein